MKRNKAKDDTINKDDAHHSSTNLIPTTPTDLLGYDTKDHFDRSVQILDAIRKGNITQNYEVRGILPQNRDVLKKMENVVPLAIEKIQEIIATSKNERAVLQAIEFLFNRVYGKAIQPIDLEAKVDNNTTVEIKLSGELDQWSR